MSSPSRSREKLLSLTALLFIAAAITVPSWMAARAQSRELALVAALEETKFSNMQIEAVPYKLSTGPVDYVAVGRTEYLTQAPAHLVAAMRRQEMGRPYRELGYHGKTQFAVEHFELQDRQYGEAGREATRELWRWVQSDKELWDDYTEFLAVGYHGGDKASNFHWAKNVRILAKQERANLQRDQEAFKKTKK